jgi:hypothetical protein
MVMQSIPGARATPAELAKPQYLRRSKPNRTETAELDRPLPQNLEAERSVLGAILLDNHALDLAIERLRPGDFFLDNHRRIFQEMLVLGETQQPIDLVILTDRLHRSGELEAAGGAAYISALVDGVPQVSNVAHYARIVRKKALLRNLIHTTHAIQQQALEDEEDVDAVLDRAKASIAQLAEGRTREVIWRDEFHTFSEFETAPPLTFAIDGFLQNDGCTMIGGLSGHGKTLVGLSIVKALLAPKGTMLWNMFPVLEPALRVIYLIPECAITPFKHRLKLFGLYEYLAPNNERLLVRTLSKGPTPCLSDPRILFACKGAHVILDTASRFSEGDENSAGDNRALASDIFALLAAGARQVLAQHHSPKPFARENVMRLENVLRGSGDIGAMLTTAWGVKQLDAEQNIIHVENLKPRDFQPCGPFQLIGRPYINETGDFSLHKRPGECGTLMDEQEPARDQGGAPVESRIERNRRIEMTRSWLTEDPNQTTEQLRVRFEKAGIKVGLSAVKNYRREAHEE